MQCHLHTIEKRCPSCTFIYDYEQRWVYCPRSVGGVECADCQNSGASTLPLSSPRGGGRMALRGLTK